MATIGATTTHSIKVKKQPGVSKSTKIGIGSATTLNKKKQLTKKPALGGRRGSVAPPLKPVAYKTDASVQELKSISDDAKKRELVELYFLKTLGEELHAADFLKAPTKTASTTRDRAGAAADVAVLCREFGISFVLKKCGVLLQMQSTLLPQNGMDGLFFARNSTANNMPHSASTASLASLETANTTATTVGTDSKRGKTTPAVAREGCLLLVRALAEALGTMAEPYLMMHGFFAAALDECGSTQSTVRQAAEDASSSLIQLMNGYALSKLAIPVLVQSLEQSTEWRVKYNAMERLAQCATKEPLLVYKLLPDLIPIVTGQVWDTKAQVSKAASTTLLALCRSNPNPDVAPAIPAVVQAICKPTLVTKAIQELMATTFVTAVDASTLSILCPVLARGLKEKLAIHKRSACLVISNMSKLVDEPSSVKPFGPLLVPELQKVAQNVQFEEIRDAALEALENLTKALGYSSMDESAMAMQETHDKVQEEQGQIDKEREEETKRQEALKKREEEERSQFKQAMEAQRQLDHLAQQEEREKKAKENLKKEKQKLSTKGASGKCQGCGLKKCKKSCLFYAK